MECFIIDKMNKIEIDTFFCDKAAHLEITTPIGCGGATYFININKFYCGRLWKTDDGWQHDLNPLAELSGDDIQILIDLIEKD